MRDHWERHEPFVAVEAFRGIDSWIAAGYASRPDGGTVRLWYDSDTRGSGAQCAATVTLSDCVRSADGGTSNEFCEPATTGERICDESRSRVLRVEQGGLLKDLWCASPEPEHEADLLLCSRSQDAVLSIIAGFEGSQAVVKVRRVDSQLFCMAWPGHPDAYGCTAERSWRRRLWLSLDDRLEPVDAPIPDGT
jgi:hypothetical protein